MNFMNDEIEEIVDEITDKKFGEFCGIEGCNEAILDAVRERVKRNVKRLMEQEDKCRAEVILSELPTLTAVFHSEKLLYYSKPAAWRKQVTIYTLI